MIRQMDKRFLTVAAATFLTALAFGAVGTTLLEETHGAVVAVGLFQQGGADGAEGEGGQEGRRGDGQKTFIHLTNHDYLP
ncbi:MAG: hypothetical protein AAFY88_17755, partial [Acidobacteriota bacterium]